MIAVHESDRVICRREEIPVLDSCDVLVAGGGIAGVSAAAAAADKGLRTILVEKNTFLCSFGGGTLKEWENSELDALWEDSRRGMRERTAQELLELMLRKKAVLYLHTMAAELHKCKNRIEGVLVATRQGMMEIRAKVFIDATDTGMLSQKAGAVGNSMPGWAKISFGLGRVNYAAAAASMKKKGISCRFTHNDETKNGELSFTVPQELCREWDGPPLPEKITAVYYGEAKISQVFGLACKTDVQREEEVNRAYLEMNGYCARLAGLLRKWIEGFEASFLDWTSPCIGLEGGFFPASERREGVRRVKGLDNLLSVRYGGGEKSAAEATPAGKWRRGRAAGTNAAALCALRPPVKRNRWTKRTVIPVTKECDVLVVGGGASGITAAIAAARNGMRTVLVERNPLPGGDMLAGGLSWLSYYNLFREFGVEEKQLVYGIGYEIAQRLAEMGGSPGFYEDLAPYTQESKGTHGDRESMKTLFLQMLLEEDVKVHLNTLFLEALTEEEDYIRGNVMRGAVVVNREKQFAIRAKVVIDASGDGDVAFSAGANCREYESHGAGMAFGVTQVDFDKALAYAREKNAVAHEAYGQTGEMRGRLVKYSLRTYFIPELYDRVKESGIHNSFCIESSHEGEGTYINGVTTPHSDILRPGPATETIIDLRRRLFRAADFLKEAIPGFEKSELNWCTQIPGARQTRCVDCRVSITEDDVINGVIPEDSIGLFGGHDGHYAGVKIKNGGWYGIPYRALLPNFIRNLLVTGRMLSADWAAYMSTRLNVACFIQGQAAGTAAAVAVRENCCVGEVDVHMLQKQLRSDGVYLPESGPLHREGQG